MAYIVNIAEGTTHNNETATRMSIYLSALSKDPSEYTKIVAHVYEYYSTSTKVTDVTIYSSDYTATGTDTEGGWIAFDVDVPYFGSYYIYVTVTFNVTGGTNTANVYDDAGAKLGCATIYPDAPYWTDYYASGTNSLYLNWSTVSGARLYDLYNDQKMTYYGLDPADTVTSGWSSVDEGMITSSNYTMTGLSAGNVYTVGAEGIGYEYDDYTGYTPAADVMTKISTPVLNSNATVKESNRIYVEYSSPTGADYWEIQWREQGTTNWSLSLQQSNSKWISGLSSSTAYEIRCQCSNSSYSGEESDWSSVATATTASAQVAPTTPGNPTVSTRGEGSITITWSGSSGATSYIVGYSGDTGSGLAYTETSTTSTSLTVSGLAFGHAFYFQVKARNAYGDSAWSSTVTIYSAPQTPTITNTAISSTAIDIKGNITSGSYSYIRIYRHNTSSVSKTTYTDYKDVQNGSIATWTGLPVGSTWYFKAMTYDSLSGLWSVSYSSLVTVTTSSRPTDWKWLSPLPVDTNNHITAYSDWVDFPATQWNNFTARINLFREYKAMATVTFTQAVTGYDFEALYVREALNAIVGIPGKTVSLIYTTVNPGDDVLADIFNNMMDSLNSIG